MKPVVFNYIFFCCFRNDSPTFPTLFIYVRLVCAIAQEIKKILQNLENKVIMIVKINTNIKYKNVLNARM